MTVFRNPKDPAMDGEMVCDGDCGRPRRHQLYKRGWAKETQGGPALTLRPQRKEYWG